MILHAHFEPVCLAPVCLAPSQAVKIFWSRTDKSALAVSCGFPHFCLLVICHVSSEQVYMRGGEHGSEAPVFEVEVARQKRTYRDIAALIADQTSLKFLAPDVPKIQVLERLRALA